ncbi:MAG: hypothetical protein ABDH37_07440 [Candidatus Hydrothermales bacterium]
MNIKKEISKSLLEKGHKYYEEIMGNLHINIDRKIVLKFQY